MKHPTPKIDALYRMIQRGRFDVTVHFYHSDVYYVRAAILAKTGIEYSLSHVESALKAEGHRFASVRVNPDADIEDAILDTIAADSGDVPIQDPPIGKS